jgi:hypothetical protein
VLRWFVGNCACYMHLKGGVRVVVNASRKCWCCWNWQATRVAESSTFFRWPASTRFGTEAQLVRKGDRAHQSGASLSMQKASLRGWCARVVGMCRWGRVYRVSE